MDFLQQYGLFLAKTATVVVALMALIGAVAALPSRMRALEREHISVRHLNRRYRNLRHTLQAGMRERKGRWARLMAWPWERKPPPPQPLPPEKRKRMFVLNFQGDIAASALAALREEITAVLMVATPEDEVVLRLESPGGLIPSYGLAASQLLRIKQRGIPLTVVADKVAASGGYLMASVADRIVAAPFAIVGSVGVIAQVPNFYRFLKKHDIDFEQFMAGEYKRTVTMFGENTDKGREKFRQELEEAHALFKGFLRQHRPQLDVDAVASGDYWYGSRALELKLVDELQTSDDYLLAASESADLYEISHLGKRRRPLFRLFAPPRLPG